MNSNETVETDEFIINSYSYNGPYFITNENVFYLYLILIIN